VGALEDYSQEGVFFRGERALAPEEDKADNHNAVGAEGSLQKGDWVPGSIQEHKFDRDARA
jgi:hypothetical protein